MTSGHGSNRARLQPTAFDTEDRPPATSPNRNGTNPDLLMSSLIVSGAPEAPLLIGHAVVASTADGRGPLLLAPCPGGPAKAQPVPTVVRCRERQQDVAL
jgi:hypothetical protein